jgi:putative hydrolase of the HAD superfamily
MTEMPLGRAGTDPDDDLSRFADIDSWVFDLDDTLYSMSSELAAAFDNRMRSFIAREIGVSEEEASLIQHDLFRRHGATARGLMIEHGVSADEFLDHVHDVDHGSIQPDPELVAAIERLPGRRFVLTNSPLSHAELVIERLGAGALFADIFDFSRAGHHAKPNPSVYAGLLAATGLAPERSAMFEDMARNLVEPQRLGMTTVLVVPPRTRELFRGEWDFEAGSPPEVDFITEDLRGFLSAVLAEIAPAR